MKIASFRSLLLASAIALSTAAVALADTAWVPASTTSPGSARAGSRDVPVKAGDDTVIAIQGLPAGASVTVLHGADVLTAEPLTANEDGKVSVPVSVPADAASGLHPLTILTQNPASVSQVVLKISDVVAAKDADAFTLETVPVGERAYQTALSNDGKLFVSTARGPNDGSRLQRLDAATLKVEAEGDVAKDSKGEQIGVFGIAVDNAHGKVWTANTLTETVTVYDAKDLSIVKVFPEASVQHPRSVVIDEGRGRAYVSAALSGFVEVYDTATLEHVGQLEFVANRGRDLFGTVELDLDAKAGKLYSVSRDTPWIGWIDLESGKSTTVKVPEAVGATDIAHDPATGRIYVVSQETNNVVTLDADGKLLANTYIGAGGVGIVWDAATSQVFAATRAGGTVAVLDADGALVANIPADDTPNHLSVGPDGAVYLTAMYGTRGDDSQVGSVTKITPKK